MADGQELDGGARAHDVLLALMHTGGTMVTKDVLLHRVWPDVVVEENNLRGRQALPGC
jgi:DNA-binding winged helix-turn-helix (wHTH) protein